MHPLTCFLTSSLFLAILPSAYGVTRQAQVQNVNEDDRVVEKLSRKPAPLKVKVIKTRKGEFQLGRKFIDKEEWFQGLSVVLENISGKTITYVGAGFLFPRQNGEVGKAPPLYKFLSYGRHPSAPDVAVQNIQPLAIKPGERIAVTFTDSDYYEVTANLKRLEYAHSIKVVQFNLQEVYFDDGTGWVAGTWFRHNPNRSVPERHPISNLSRSVPTFFSFKRYEPENTLSFLK